jgi:hypothetical protein
MEVRGIKVRGIEVRVTPCLPSVENGDGGQLQSKVVRGHGALE